MSETFKEVEPLIWEPTNSVMAALRWDSGQYVVLYAKALHTPEQALALRDWLNKALGEPHE